MAFGVAAAFGLSAAGVANAGDLTQTISAADAAWSAAVARGDARAVAAIYSADGQLLAPGSDPVKGTAALTKFIQGIIDAGASSIALTTLEVVGQGRYATEVGSYVMKDKAGTEMDHGKYMELWRLEKGVWKLHRDIFNSSVAPPK
jgi:ketosteroid isomerase-like protein